MINSNKEIVITGAAGFIGSRLVEMASHQSWHPLCVIQSFKNLARVGRLPIHAIQWDMLKDELPSEIPLESAVVVHMAYTKALKDELNFKANVEGTKRLLALCEKKKAAHFIYVSSTAVYDEMPSGTDIQENTVPSIGKEAYGYDKSVIEEYLKKEAPKLKIPITIIRPAIVYGPFAPAWTIRVYQWIKNDVLKAYGKYDGKCNLSYVDNVTNFILACAKNPNAFGRTYNLVDPCSISWSQYFAKYEFLLTKHIQKGRYLPFCIKYKTREMVIKVLKKIFQLNPQLFRPIRQKAVQKSAAIGSFLSFSGPDPASIDLFQKIHQYDIDRNYEILPKEKWVDFEQAWKTLEMYFEDYSY